MTQVSLRQSTISSTDTVLSQGQGQNNQKCSAANAIFAWRRSAVIAAAASLCVFGTLSGGQVAAADAPRMVVEKILKLEGSPGAVAWSPDGKLLATADTLNLRIVIWDYATAKPLHTIKKSYFGGSGPNALSFTPDGRYVATSAVAPKGRHNRASLSLIDVTTGEVRDIDGPEENPTAVSDNIAILFAFSSSTHYAAMVTQKTAHFLSLYDTRTWKPIATHKLMRDANYLKLAAAINFSPSTGALAFLSVGGDLDIWDPATDQVTTSIKAHQLSGGALTFRPDGDSLATSERSRFGGDHPDPDAIRLWSISTWQLMARSASVAGHPLLARALSFSSDGRYLAALNEDAKARLLDAVTLGTITEIDDGGRGGVALAFAPDSLRLAIARDYDVRILSFE